MEKNKIKLLSTVKPTNPLPFNEWIGYIHKAVAETALNLEQRRLENYQPTNFNDWAYLIHNTRN